MQPEGFLAHSTDTRLRIKIPSKRGDRSYFGRLQEECRRFLAYRSVHVSPSAASILLEDEGIDVEAFLQFAETRGFFRLNPEAGAAAPIEKRVLRPLRQFSSRILAFTSGEVDLKKAIFVGLLAIGALQVFRGRLPMPPWYTAFWYAFGIFTKLMMDDVAKQKSPD